MKEGGILTALDPATGSVLYGVRADAFAPMGGGTTACSPFTQTTTMDINSQPLQVAAGTTTVPQRLDFFGCS
jgi:hypothetical protein